MNWPAYPAYQKVGSDWLTRVPVHWLTTKLKWSASLITSGSRGWAQFYADEGDYFVRIGNLSRGSLGFDDSDVQCVQIPSGAEGSRTITRSGDLLFSITAYLGSVAVVDSAHTGGYVSQHVSLVRLAGRLLDPYYAGYVSLSEVGQRQLTEQAYGGTKIQLGLDDIGNLEVPLPPVEEQRQIAKFLDCETTKIDALIGKQQQLIATLREDRTATITHAVTKGLDPDVDMRDSGVEWLGDVPVHWSTRRLATSYRELDERLGSGEAPELLSVSIHLGVRPRSKLVTDKEARADDFTKYKLCSAGDIVLNRMRAFQGGLGVAPTDGIVSPDYMVMRVHPTECADFLGYLMKTPWFVEQMTARLRGIGGVDQGNARTPRINPKDLGSIEVALPPSGEQREIAHSLRSELSTLDDLVAKTEQLIETMREYRSALITDTVTGKIDVRGAA